MAITLIVSILLAMEAIFMVLNIGKPRPPITPEIAAISLVFNALLIAALWIWR